ncbi:hypothetical protein DIPPA_18514 [Diplonema papillatum]|nr:hypothetical protein DIPPA_18514 [Diplonema papillatum]
MIRRSSLGERRASRGGKPPLKLGDSWDANHPFRDRMGSQGSMGLASPLVTITKFCPGGAPAPDADALVAPLSGRSFLLNSPRQRLENPGSRPMSPFRNRCNLDEHVLSTPQAHSPSSCCIRSTSRASVASKAPSVLLASPRGNLHDYMSDLQRSASKAINQRQLLSSVNSSVSVPTEPVEPSSEIERLTAELNQREEELVDACEIGQQLVTELEAAREDIAELQQHELRLHEELEHAHDDMRAARDAHKEARREVNELRVVRAKADEELRSMHELLEVCHRQSEEKMSDWMENNTWILQNVQLATGGDKPPTPAEKLAHAEMIARNAAEEAESTGRISLQSLAFGSTVALANQLLAYVHKKDEQCTELAQHCTAWQERAAGFEEVAEERRVEARALRDKLHKMTQKQALFSESNGSLNGLSRSNSLHMLSAADFSRTMQQASATVGQLLKVCEQATRKPVQRANVTDSG